MLLAGKALPPVLVACLPRLRTRRWQETYSGERCLAYTRDTAAPIRGLLALLLRSVATKEHAANFCAAAAEPDARCSLHSSLLCRSFSCKALLSVHHDCLQCACRQEWDRRAHALVLLCAGVLGAADGGGRDGLLEMAAARLLVLLQSADYWACIPKGAMQNYLKG